MPGARPDEVVDLLVGLGVAERRVHLDRDEVRHRQSDGPSELARQPFGDERARSLAGARNLTTYRPSSSASTRPGSEPPSRSGVT